MSFGLQLESWRKKGLDEDINFTSWQKGLFGKQVGNSSIGKFINQILPFVAWKRGVYYQKVDKDFTSQECPNCRLPTGKKALNERIHKCQYCGDEIDRDVAAAKIIELRGRVVVGQPVQEKACGGDVTGVVQNCAVRSSWHPMKQEFPVSDGGSVNNSTWQAV